MKKPSSRKGRYFRYAAIALAIVIVAAAGLFCLYLWEKGQDEYPSLDYIDSIIELNGKKYAPKKNVETLLLLGLDKFDGGAATDDDAFINNKQADFLLLMVFDNDAGTCSAVQINRDTMANIGVLGVAGNRIETVTKQIALAHTYGNGKEVSCRNTADAVSDLLHGVDIDSFISLAMDAVPIYNDLLGGIEVTVLDDFGGIDAELVKGERVVLKGEQALTYVRARQGMEDASNLARMERQKQYLNALMQKSAERSKDEDFIIESSLKMADYIVSDRTVNQLQALADKLSSYEVAPIISIAGETEIVDGLNQFRPDEEAVMQLVLDLFYDEVK